MVDKPGRDSGASPPVGGTDCRDRCRPPRLLVSEGSGTMAPLHLPRLPRSSNRQLQRHPWALLHPICWAAQNTVSFEWDPEQGSIRSELEL